jgi:hypothetical protein
MGLVVVTFVIVEFDQTGRTGLLDSHSTAGLAVVAAAVGPARSSTPPDVGGDGPHALKRAHPARKQVPKGGCRRSRGRSPLPRAHS